MVPNPNTLPPPSLSLSGALWAHKGPNYETRGAPPPISPATMPLAAPSPRQQGSEEEGPGPQQASGCSPAIAHPLLLSMTLEAAQLLGSDCQGLGQMPQKSLIYGQRFKQRAHQTGAETFYTSSLARMGTAQ